jgi:mRNA interferase MazF
LTDSWRFELGAPRALIIYVPLTTQNRQSLYGVPIPKIGFLNALSVANVQGIASIPSIRLERKLGKLPDGTMAGIRRALFFALDLGDPAN